MFKNQKLYTYYSPPWKDYPSFSLCADRLTVFVAFQLPRGNLEARCLRLLAFPDMFEKNVFGAGAQGESIYTFLSIL